MKGNNLINKCIEISVDESIKTYLHVEGINVNLSVDEKLIRKIYSDAVKGEEDVTCTWEVLSEKGKYQKHFSR